MDEINSLIPGSCTFQLVPDTDLNKKYNVDHFVKPKLSIDKNNPEHLLAEEYGNTIKRSMEEGMKETFDIINSEIKPGATNENSPYWRH